MSNSSSPMEGLKCVACKKIWQVEECEKVGLKPSCPDCTARCWPVASLVECRACDGTGRSAAQTVTMEGVYHHVCNFCDGRGKVPAAGVREPKPGGAE